MAPNGYSNADTERQDATKSVKSVDGLSPSQNAMIALMTTFPPLYDTIEEMAAKVGVSRATYYRWMDIDTFTKKLQKETEKAFRSEGAAIRAAHISKARDGDVAAIKLFYQRAENWKEGLLHGSDPDNPLPSPKQKTVVIKVKK